MLKKRIFLILFVISVYYLGGYLYYQYLLPYTVEEGSFQLENTPDIYEFRYIDPDITYRDMIVEITLINGDPIEITYMKCSDDYKIVLNEGTTKFIHNMAGYVYLRLVNTSSSASGTYRVIDRVSLLIPKSATTACTSMPGITFAFNYTIILVILSSIASISYLLIFKQDLLKDLLKKSK